MGPYVTRTDAKRDGGKASLPSDSLQLQYRGHVQLLNDKLHPLQWSAGPQTTPDARDSLLESRAPGSRGVISVADTGKFHGFGVCKRTHFAAYWWVMGSADRPVMN